jgi:hypothetical protein
MYICLRNYALSPSQCSSALLSTWYCARELILPIVVRSLSTRGQRLFPPSLHLRLYPLLATYGHKPSY